MIATRRLVILVFVLAVVAATPFALNPGPHAQGRFEWPEKAENLKVLPKDFPKERLRAVMTGFTRALGVRCSHCHVGEEGQPLSTYDFPSDENPKKNIARDMLEMLGDINKDLKKMELAGEDRVNMWCHTCHGGRALPRRLSEELILTYEKDGIDSTITRYRVLRARFYGRGAYDFGLGTLNELGYGALGKGDHEAAIAMFRLNVEHFPESGNAYDSLAEGYMTAGQKELAIHYYEKALALAPENKNAAAKLEELRAGNQ